MKKLWLGHFVYLYLMNMVASDLHAVLAMLISLSGRLGKVCCSEISHTPSGSFKEISWVRVRPASSLFTPSRLTSGETVAHDGQEIAAFIA
jgi:hypothetical protein